MQKIQTSKLNDRNIMLFESSDHQFIFLNQSNGIAENGIQSNQYLIKHADVGVLLDPGGAIVMPQVLSHLLRYIAPSDVVAIILSHQDPDVVAGLSTWVELIKAPIYISKIWTRFLPHYGVKNIKQFFPIPDIGMDCTFKLGFNLTLIPAHFLHSEGNFNVYDPIAKILFTGDIGAAIMPRNDDTVYVDDFEAHLPHIHWFHRRFMCSNKAVRMWVETIQKFDINMLAPQHGPIYRGQAVKDFIEWFKNLRCGIDLMSAGGVFKDENTL